AARLLTIDRDTEAILASAERFDADPRVRIEHARFDRLAELLAQHGMRDGIDGVLMDLGVSSPQLDDPARGFSFLRDGLLDMRMDSSQGPTAAEWIARASQEEIERVLREYGEERFARRMAAAIVRERRIEPIATTVRLAGIVAAANPAWERDKHPATRAFQAIRIVVNAELDALSAALRQACEALRPGGRLVVISFHSLEDRIVKRFIRDNARPAGAPGLPASMQPRLRAIGRAIRAGDAEVAANPRARSAVLRVAERLAVAGSRAHG
ncbi:MAG: 16S rRNA (cytosine(1402)-N(4))-methyltransferase RsmH, partial [Gammaproteobacteria bacterium]